MSDQQVEVDEAKETRPVGGAGLLAGFVVAVAALLVLGVGVEVVTTVAASGGDVAVGVDQDLLDERAVEDALPAGAHLEAGEVAHRLVVDELPLALRLATVAGALAGVVLTAIGAWLLVRLLGDIGSGRPFTAAAPGRLRWLAMLVLAGALFPSLLDGAAAAVVFDHLDIAGSSAPMSYTILQLDGQWLLLAAVIAVLAQAFAHGQRLAHEVEGLV